VLSFPTTPGATAATPDELKAANVVVLLSDHDAFDYEVIAADASHVRDTRHRLTAADNVEFL